MTAGGTGGPLMASLGNQQPKTWGYSSQKVTVWEILSITFIFDTRGEMLRPSSVPQRRVHGAIKEWATGVTPSFSTMHMVLNYFFDLKIFLSARC